ncbi:tRNA (adenosine(37)-N6)-threonylcarbamoyltransferase complex dimerization subunit type 1 TsaB [Lentisalinibacter salinarum]|uniref:tRNA (adenosine(37)-N6)-threonylcarbamoyltransferase complex dimerization subunit type 1 TsaB n=1 Tax=Lentisalinibacter salinarum TaxID=2992239 RepID=UPI003868EBD7
MKILALETSADACSAALWVDGEVAEVYEEQPRRHVELILPMVRGLLAEAGMRMAALDGIAFGAGPGSFTGVRIAVSAAQGFGLAAGLALVPVSSLAALASRALAGGARRVYVTQDARMGEVYAGAWEEGADGLHTLAADRLTAPAAVQPAEGDWWLAGGGWDRYPQMAPAGAADTGLRFPRAQEVAALAAPRFAAGDTLAPRDAQPAYLRRTVARQAP